MAWAPTAKATADALRLTRDERSALRRAGLTAGDLVSMDADAIVAATYEEIAEARADLLVRLAAFVALGIGTNPALTLLERLGVQDLDDLVTREPAELFIANVERCAHTHPGIYDSFCRAIYLARCALDGVSATPERYLPVTWARERETNGIDPMAFVWRARHPDAIPPTPTKDRLRLPTIGVSAPIHDGSQPTTEPVGQSEVVRTILADGTTVFVGHWMWNGGYGPFARLDHLMAGDGVDVASAWYAVDRVEHHVGGERPLVSEDVDHGDIVLATPFHRRVGEIGMEDDVAPVERSTLRVIARCRPAAAKDAVDIVRRPLKRPGLKNR